MNDNHIDYVELYATDLGVAKKFYQETFGWTFTDYGPNYVAFSNSGLEGGFAKVDEMKPGGPLVILYHSNLEAALENVTKHGATISKEIFSFPGGRRFEFTDPAGNQLAVWSTE